MASRKHQLTIPRPNSRSLAIIILALVVAGAVFFLFVRPGQTTLNKHEQEKLEASHAADDARTALARVKAGQVFTGEALKAAATRADTALPPNSAAAPPDVAGVLALAENSGLTVSSVQSSAVYAASSLDSRLLSTSATMNISGSLPDILSYLQALEARPQLTTYEIDATGLQPGPGGYALQNFKVTTWVTDQPDIIGQSQTTG